MEARGLELNPSCSNLTYPEVIFKIFKQQIQNEQQSYHSKQTQAKSQAPDLPTVTPVAVCGGPETPRGRSGAHGLQAWLGALKGFREAAIRQPESKVY